jgi:hypothetical protein
MAFLSLRSQVNRFASMAEQSAVKGVTSQLHTTDVTYDKLTVASLEVLRERTLQDGPPRIEGTAMVGTREVPALWFGSTSVVNQFEIVDGVVKLTGGTATLFVRSGEDFVRVSTNVKKPDGSRAIGTVLDPKGRAIKSISSVGPISQPMTPSSPPRARPSASGTLATPLRHSTSCAPKLKTLSFSDKGLLRSLIHAENCSFTRNIFPPRSIRNSSTPTRPPQPPLGNPPRHSVPTPAPTITASNSTFLLRGASPSSPPFTRPTSTPRRFVSSGRSWV